MKLNRKFFAALLVACLVLSTLLPASAAVLDANYGEASYYDIATTTYSRMLLFHGGVVPAANQAKKYGLIDATGKVVIPFQYDGIESLGGELFVVTMAVDEYTDQRGIIDATGKILYPLSDCYIECRNETIRVMDYSDYSESYYTLTMAPSNEAAFWGSDSGDIPGYDYGWSMYTGYYMAYKDDQCALLDSNYKPVFPLGMYDYINWIYTENAPLFVVTKGDSTALVTAANQVIVPFGTYDYFMEDYRGSEILKVSSGEQMGAIDYTGKVLVPLGDYDEIGGLNRQGYISAASYDGDPWSGMTNLTSKVFKNGAEVKSFPGKLVTTEVYFRDLAFTTDGSLNGMMDVNGTILLPEKFSAISTDYNDNLLTLTETQPGSWEFVRGLYDFSGKQIFADKYTELNYLTDDKYQLNDGLHYGVMNISGSTVIPFNYEDMRVHTYSFIELFDGARYSIVDLSNKVIVPPSSEPIHLFKDPSSLPLEDSLSRAAWYSEEYDGYTDYVMPVYGRVSGGYTTYYTDIFTGEVSGQVPYRASNINDQGQFVYQAANGLFGFATLKGSAAVPTAKASSTTILVDGKEVRFDAYALLDANGYQTNYLKLRDVANILNGTKAQFQVGWDGSVNLTTGTAYTANGSEMSTPFSGDQPYENSTAATKVNGTVADLGAIVLKDANGGGYTYYKLRDLGQALGFNVRWDGEAGVIRVETDQPYSG